MKIHTNLLTSHDVYAATMAGGMRGVNVECVTQGSRSRKRGLTVHLTGNSTRRPNGGNRGANKDSDGYAATWDEWGMFLQYLFDLDPDAIATGAYNGLDDFGMKTNWRFEGLTADKACPNHKWEYAGVPREHTCKKCEAVRRF